MQKELIMRCLSTEFCHASTVLALSDGSLLCCWFGGTHEGENDVGIYLSRRTEAGWSQPQLLVNGAAANWNPVLFVGADARILLFYKQGQQIADWQTWLLQSTDNGETWSGPQELVPGDVSGGRGPVRNKPLRLASGRILAGASTEHGIWKAFADISDDDGASWHKSAVVQIDGLQYQAGEKTAESNIAVSQQSFYGRGVIQPSLWQSADGSVHMLLRSSEGFVYRSDSADNGETWCSAYALSLPNNNSGLDLVRTAGGVLYLVCNPVAANWGQRSPLSLFQSTDEGASWRRLLDLETEPAEFSYPAIIALGEDIVITYTYKRCSIACVSLSADELVNL
ncbi:exo-alpha-sialidase [uncultured Phascolarctobacterium sp.]|uniref:sialidase family protein n=1 Tax=uncultured Phascolarctobacterium sp. TaxID=512296 RepID=UPI0025EE8E25|nr:sialidase family protein [uncultured Phascolarctobacterium sp.]